MTNRQVTNMEVKKNNRNRIFRHICKCDRISNPDIAYALKMSLPTVTQNTKELMERGLVQEVGEQESTGGRRAKALSVAADFRLAVGLDITKNHISMLLANLTGEILKYSRVAFPFRKEESYYCEVNKKLEAFIEESHAERERILGIGISFPGIVDLQREAVTYSHILGVELLPFASVSRFFDYPCYFLNDANAGAYAESSRSEYAERFFYLSLSNTVGGAMVSNHKLMQGKNFRCGEAGHMTIMPKGETCYCGKQGCLDVYCSAKRLAESADGRLEHFFADLERGETAAAELWEDYTDCLAVAVNNIHMILDCDIILGGYVGSYLETYMEEIWKKVSQRNTFAEETSFVKACNYKVEAAALGAALKVIETFIEQV